MTPEEVIQKIRDLVVENNLNCTIAVQSDAQNKVCIAMRGDEQKMGGCLISLLGSGQIGPHNLATLGTYCIAQAKGLKGFGDARKFGNYLMGCADMYQQHSDMINPNTKGLS